MPSQSAYHSAYAAGDDSEDKGHATDGRAVAVAGRDLAVGSKHLNGCRRIRTRSLSSAGLRSLAVVVVAARVPLKTPKVFTGYLRVYLFLTFRPEIRVHMPEIYGKIGQMRVKKTP